MSTKKKTLNPTSPEAIRARALVASLLPYYPSKAALSRALNLSDDRRLREAQNGTAGEPLYQMFLERAEKLLASHETPGGSKKTALPAEQPRPITLIELLEHGGGSGSSSVPFTLTQASFRYIEGDPGSEIVAVARRSLRLSRGLLNLFAQLKDERVRARVRRQLSREVEELFLSIKTFNAEIPTSVLDIFDAQRTTWEAFANSGKGGR